MFVSGLKPEIFREEIYSRAFETLVDVMAETRHELANYRDIMEISERINRSEPRKDSKNRTQMLLTRELQQSSFWGVFHESIKFWEDN